MLSHLIRRAFGNLSSGHGFPSGALANRGWRPVARRRRRSAQRFAPSEALESRTLLTAYLVDSLGDDVTAGDNQLTLREALEAANTNVIVGDAAAGSDTEVDTIAFADGLNGTITLDGTQLTITDDVTITGLGADQLAVSGNNASRVFEIASGITAEITGLTITGGSQTFGGGLVNRGILTLNSVVVSDNTATASDGGGIRNNGTLTLTDSTVSDNTASGSGGGIHSAGTLTLTGGCGGMGGAQPLAVTLNGGACLIVDVNAAHLQRRVDHRYLDEWTDDLDTALAAALRARQERRGWSVGLVGNAAEVVPELLRRGVDIDVVTDQTSAHDPLSYLPVGISFDDWASEAERDPEGFTVRARESMARHVEAMVGFADAGAEVFDYGNSIRGEALLGGYARAFDFPGFVPAYIRPLFCEGKGPFRWAALSGDPADIAATDRAVLELFADNEGLQRWIRAAHERVAFQGLPSRICWLGYGERDQAGLRFNELVASGEVSAPLVIGRDHLDCGSVASPYRETESMLDGSDAIADWPLLNALVNTASGASWVSIHHGGGVGIGRSIHAGQVSVADGTPLAAQKLERVLTNDPGMGVIRHVDAGYPEALEVAERDGVRIPMREG